MGWFGRKDDMRQGNTLLAQGKIDAALECFLRHAKRSTADRADALARAGQCYRRSNRLSAPVDFGAGVTLVSEADNENAEICYRKALEADPDHVESMIGLSEILPSGDERIGLLEQIISKQPRASAYVELGEEHYRLEGYDSAKVNYEKATQLRPRDQTAYDRLAALCRKQGLSEEAAAWKDKWSVVNSKRRRVGPSR